MLIDTGSDVCCIHEKDAQHMRLRIRETNLTITGTNGDRQLCAGEILDGQLRIGLQAPDDHNLGGARGLESPYFDRRSVVVDVPWLVVSSDVHLGQPLLGTNFMTRAHAAIGCGLIENWVPHRPDRIHTFAEFKEHLEAQMGAALRYRKFDYHVLDGCPHGSVFKDFTIPIEAVGDRRPYGYHI